MAESAKRLILEIRDLCHVTPDTQAFSSFQHYTKPLYSWDQRGTVIRTRGL
ncbi:hypothetical protein V6Z11_D12G264300 [Gossypium hirsutum]